jgi:5'-methylthioinosine phosphorylase
MLALIGGSGLYGLDGSDRLVAEGPVSLGQSRYGEPSAPVFRYRAESGEILFLPRHGIDHSIAPHLIDYRANIDALLRAGASRIVGVCSVGAIETGIEPGSLVLPDQLIDYTWGRDQTFHLPGEPVVHVDFTEPFDPSLRAAISGAMDALGVPFTDGGTYGAVQGPRFESSAEIRKMARDGCTVVGMTGMPEAGLARETGVPYAALCPVGNLAAGNGPGPIEFETVRKQAAVRSRTVIDIALGLLPG